MQTIDLAIQLIVTSADTGLAVDIVETSADDPSDVRSVKSAISVLMKLAAKFDPEQHEFVVYIDPEARTFAETKRVGLEPGTPRRCRKERLCVPFGEQERGVVADQGGSYPVDLDTYVIGLLAVADKAPGDNPERRAFIKGWRSWCAWGSEPETDGAEREGFRAAARDNESGGERPIASDAFEAYQEWADEREPAVKAEPKPVEAFPGREERRRAELLPQSERQWVEETVQGVAGIIAEVATGKDIYLDESEFITVAAEVEDRIDPALAAVLLDEVGERFRRRPRVVWLNITDSATEWALAEAERRASEGAEDGPTEALLDRIRAAIRRTWGAIAHDILTAAGADTLPLDEVVEVTLDADHVHSHGGDREAAKALDLFDYEKQNELAKAALSF